MKKRTLFVIALCIVIIFYIFYNREINYNGVIVASSIGNYKDFGEFSIENNIGLHGIHDFENNKEYTNRQSYLYLRKTATDKQLVACYYDADLQIVKIGLINYLEGNFELENTLYTANSQEVTITYPLLHKKKLFFIQSDKGVAKLIEYDLNSKKESVLIDNYQGLNYHILGNSIFYSVITNNSSYICEFDIKNNKKNVWKKDVLLGDISSDSKKIVYYKNDTFHINDTVTKEEVKHQVKGHKIMRVLIADEKYALIVTRKDNQHLYATQIYNLKTRSSKYIFKSLGNTFLPKTITWMN